MFKALIFDLDRTLLDHDYAVERALAAIYDTFPEHPDHINLEMFTSIWLGKEKHHFNRFVNGEITAEQMRWDRLQDVFDTCGIPLPDNKIKPLDSYYIKEYENNWKLFPETLGVIRNLNEYKEYPMGIITNGRKKQQQDKVKTTGIESFFKSIIISEAVGCAKPEAKIFKLAAKKMKVEIEECVYIGDSYETDYLGAKEAGMPAIFLNRDGKKIDSGSINEISNLEELPLFLELLQSS